MTIPYIKDIEFEYGRVDQLTPLVRRVIAKNPGAFTYTGTGVYIIGRGKVAVIDPGPDMDDHFEAVKAAVAGETVTHVLVTHSHMDHSPLSHPLARWAGCQVHAAGPCVPTEAAVRVEAGDDLSFTPDIVIDDGWTCQGPGWTVSAITTPGHTSNHVCYALKEEHALFSGDHIMGWSTSVISPPDGDMGAYMHSLQKVRERSFTTIYPSHGAPIAQDTDGFIDAYIDHRHRREQAIVAALATGLETIPQMVRHIYTDVDPRLHPAAAHSVLAHLIHMHKKGVVTAGPQGPVIDSPFALAAPAEPSA